MASQPTAAAAEHARPAPPEARHRHDSACFWDVDECRWQCVTYPLLGYALERCTATVRPVADNGPGGDPPAGLEVNAPHWYARGFAEAVAEVGADRDRSPSPLG